MKSIRILGTGSYVPPKILSNNDLQRMGLDTSHDWIVKRTGIHERRIAGDGVFTSDLALEASVKALDMAGISAGDLGLVIVGTITPDTHCPAASNWLQAKLGATGAVNFDITAACSGFIYAINVATQYLNSGFCKYALVVGSEVMSRVVNWADRTTCILWGDGAGAAVLSAGNSGHEILSSHIHTDGANGKDLQVPGGGSMVTPISHDSVDRCAHYLKMIEANASFRVAVRRFIESAREAADFSRIPIDRITWFIPHQANFRMIQAVAKGLDVPVERFYVTISKYGNSSSASCAIALDEAARDGSLKAGDIICMPVFGGGLTWGSALIRW